MFLALSCLRNEYVSQCGTCVSGTLSSFEPDDLLGAKNLNEISFSMETSLISSPYEKCGLTLRPKEECQASTHRQWDADRFTSRTGQRYTVKGKGGLIREIMLSDRLAAHLEEKRFTKPQRVTDRGVKYNQHYDIGAGRAWSQSFSAASKRELGFSNGAHGLRHSYAQNHMKELQGSGMLYNEAKGTLAQEVGHFDKETTEAYLR